MNNALETVYYAHEESDKRVKIEVFHDEEALDPTTAVYFTCPLNVALSGYDSTGAVGWSDFTLQEAIERMNGDMSAYGGSQGLSSSWTKRESEHLENLVNAVNRYAALCGLEERLFMFHLTGHSQSDWATVLVEATDENTAKDHFDLWSDWANGYTYGVLATEEVYDIDSGFWLPTGEQDSLWGLDGFGYDAREAAHCYASLPELVLTEIGVA